MRTIYSFFIAIFLFAAALSSCNGNGKNSEQLAQEEKITYSLPAPTNIEEYELKKIVADCALFYDTLLFPSGFNGGMLVAKNGNIVFEKYKGSLNLDDVEPVTNSTPMHIASVSKTFTAMAVLKLQEMGKLNINDSLHKYFPNFPYKNVTIKTLLNHRSGLPNYLHWQKETKWPDSVPLLNKDILQLLITKKDVLTDIAPANTKFSYNNTNYALLALVIEKASGMSYPKFLKKQIFDAIGMKNTFVRELSTDSSKLTNSFDWKGRLMHTNNLDFVYGDKNIYSTVRDLLRWDLLLSDTQFLKPATLALAYTPYSNEKPGIKNYGLGWRMDLLDSIKSKKIIFHNGWWHGNNAVFVRLIKEKATIILLSNRFARATYHAKILANTFGEFYTAPEEKEEVVPLNIPEQYTEDKKKAKKQYGFKDLHKDSNNNEGIRIVNNN
jgi:CubicO group peptidase (beta-lactamase class C family)